MSTTANTIERGLPSLLFLNRPQYGETSVMTANTKLVTVRASVKAETLKFRLSICSF